MCESKREDSSFKVYWGKHQKPVLSKGILYFGAAFIAGLCRETVWEEEGKGVCII